MTENRRGSDLRVQASFRVVFGTVDELVIAACENISRGGMQVRSERPLKPGTPVDVTVELPDAGPALTVPCRVVVVSRRAGADAFTLGVKFEEAPEQLQQRLEWFILNSEPEPGQFGGGEHACTLDVLVVDDEPRQREMTSAPFRKRGDTVRTAENGLEALTECMKQPPSLVISDVQMPGMDGWQFLRMVRARPALQRVPVIFLTTLSGERERLLGYRLGVDDYISKPPRPDDLLARADRAAVRALQMTRSRQESAADALRGDLQHVGLPSILAFLEMERKTGVLRVGPRVNGSLLLYEGRVSNVALQGADQLSLEERALRLLDVTDGRFEFVAQPVDGPGSGISVSGLLMEHARRADEAAR